MARGSNRGSNRPISCDAPRSPSGGRLCLSQPTSSSGLLLRVLMALGGGGERKKNYTAYRGKPDAGLEDRRNLGEAGTEDKAKAIAQADYDRTNCYST